MFKFSNGLIRSGRGWREKQSHMVVKGGAFKQIGFSGWTNPLIGSQGLYKARQRPALQYEVLRAA